MNTGGKDAKLPKSLKCVVILGRLFLLSWLGTELRQYGGFALQISSSDGRYLLRNNKSPTKFKTEMLYLRVDSAVARACPRVAFLQAIVRTGNFSFLIGK